MQVQALKNYYFIYYFLSQIHVLKNNVIFRSKKNILKCCTYPNTCTNYHYIEQDSKLQVSISTYNKQTI